MARKGTIYDTPLDDLCDDVRNAVLNIRHLTKRLSPAKRLQVKKQLSRIETALFRFCSIGRESDD